MDIAALGAVRGLARPAARLHRAAVVRARRVLGHLGVRHRAGRDPLGRAVPGRRPRRRARRDGARGADRLPVGAPDRHLLRDGDAGLRADDLLRRQPVARRHRRRERAAGRAEELLRHRAGRDRLVLLLLRRRCRSSCSGCASPGGSCTRRSAGCWSRSGTTRPGPGRSATTCERYKLIAFVLSAGLAGLGRRRCSPSATGSSSLQELHWTTSGKVVLMTVLGGIGTLWGGAARRGADRAARGLARHRPASTGSASSPAAIFVLVVLLFRRGIWGTARQVVAWFQRRRRQRGQSKM